MNKYVIFKQKNMLIPVIIPCCGTHSTVTMTGATPISAGFFVITKHGLPSVIKNMPSESLNLGPGERDEDLLTNMFLGYTDTMWFLDTNFNESK